MRTLSQVNLLSEPLKKHQLACMRLVDLVCSNFFFFVVVVVALFMNDSHKPTQLSVGL